MMRQPTTLNAEDQQLLELTFRRKWKQVNHEYEQAIRETRNSNQRRRKSEAMSNLASDHGCLCTVNADSDSSEAEIHAAQGQNFPNSSRPQWAASPNQERLEKCLFK